MKGFRWYNNPLFMNSMMGAYALSCISYLFLFESQKDPAKWQGIISAILIIAIGVALAIAWEICVGRPRLRREEEAWKICDLVIRIPIQIQHADRFSEPVALTRPLNLLFKVIDKFPSPARKRRFTVQSIKAASLLKEIEEAARSLNDSMITSSVSILAASVRRFIL